MDDENLRVHWVGLNLRWLVISRMTSVDMCLLTKRNLWFKSFLHFNSNILRGLFGFFCLPSRPGSAVNQKWLCDFTRLTSPWNGTLTLLQWPVGTGHTLRFWPYGLSVTLPSLKSPQLPVWSWKFALQLSSGRTDPRGGLPFRLIHNRHIMTEVPSIGEIQSLCVQFDGALAWLFENWVSVT